MSRPRTGNKRQRLIDAAVRLFARKGYFYTTTAEVSAQAGVASGTLYLYFNSKDDLLAAALNEFLEAFEREVLPQARRCADARSGLRAFVDSFTDFITRNQDLARVFFVESRQSNSALLSQASAAEARYFGLTQSFLASLGEGIDPAVLDEELVTSTVLGTLETVAVRWLFGRAALSPTDNSDSITERLLAGVEHTFAGEPGAVMADR